MPLLFFMFLALASCAENFIYNESKPQLSVEILNTSKKIFLIGESVQLQAEINPSPSDAENYYWIIVLPDTSKRSPSLKFSQELTSKGFYHFTFYASDRFSDTLSKSLTITASSNVICKDSINLSIFQGSPTFSWQCHDEDPKEKLSYNFKIKNSNDSILLDTALQKSEIQWGYEFKDDFKAHLTATNGLGFKVELDYIRSEDE
ncbi:MAG: hypothetical protein LBH25_10770 [Fibromonadaceae bacterium]|nr:hypothetical protein [Fibromonadaceae bacterium]